MRLFIALLLLSFPAHAASVTAEMGAVILPSVYDMSPAEVIKFCADNMDMESCVQMMEEIDTETEITFNVE